MSGEKKKQSSGFATRPDINRTVQPQKMARDLKLRIKAADMRLCFRIISVIVILMINGFDFYRK